MFKFVEYKHKNVFQYIINQKQLLQQIQRINISHTPKHRQYYQQKYTKMKNRTIKKNNTKGNEKFNRKNQRKDKRKNHKNIENQPKDLNDQNDYEIQSISGSQELDGENVPIIQKPQKFQSVEQVKQRISKSMLQKLNMNTKKNNRQKDDFFIVDENEQDQRKNLSAFLGKQKVDQTIDEDMIEQLKHQHMRKQNKLYESLTDQFQNMHIEQPIEYKGHLQTITAIQATKTNIFSCSKDRSIIRWDRQTGKKDFISLGKQLQHHRAEILCMSLHTTNQNVLATAGEDTLIKMWDVRAKNCIGTLKGHRSTVNGIKFGLGSNILCSVSKDLTLKQWDVSQKGLMETFFQHNNQVLDIDHFNGTDFATCGNDHQTIVWKTQKQTKIVYKGHQYAIDRVRGINQERFVTACMDGSINLWYAKRNKAIFKQPEAHKGWICALDTLKQSNIFASGGTDNRINIWGIDPDMKNMHKIRQIQMKGIVTDIKLFNNELIATECQQHRLGRWITAKTRNKIKVFKFVDPKN